MIGENARTGKIIIGRCSESHFDDVIIDCEVNLGEVQVVVIGNDNHGIIVSDSNWYVDFSCVINLKTNKERYFPCYHWIGPGEHFSNASQCGKLKRCTIP